MRKPILSEVEGHKGLCLPTWLNRNQICHWSDGGVTGFFRNVIRRWWGWKKVGEEFHGILYWGGGLVVQSMEVENAKD